MIGTKPVSLKAQLIAGLGFVAFAASIPAVAEPGTPNLKVVDRIAAGGDGGWDYVSIDQAARKLYITRGASIMSVNADTGKPILNLAMTNRSHQVVPINGGKELLVTNGGDATVAILSAVTGKTRVTTTVSAGPDAAILEPTTGLVLVMGHKSGNVDLIDPVTGSLLGSIIIGGTLEYAAADGTGRAFVNVEDKNEIVAIDMKTRTVIGRFKMAGCEEPTGLAFLAPNDLLLAACGNGVAVFVSPDTGAVVQTLKIGEGSDAAFYDGVRQLAYVPSGAAGTLSVIAVKGQTAKIVETVVTAKGARLGMVDTETGKVYLPAAKYAPPTTAGGRPTVVPGSFEILVVGQ
jgi:outer membrane protein assembly factor BamB